MLSNHVKHIYTTTRVTYNFGLLQGLWSDDYAEQGRLIAIHVKCSNEYCLYLQTNRPPKHQ